MTPKPLPRNSQKDVLLEPVVANHLLSDLPQEGVDRGASGWNQLRLERQPG